MKNKIGIICLCTNAYFCLGIRFVKRFVHFYKGDAQIKFYLFTDVNPVDYLPEGIDYEFIYTTNDNWVDGTNLKFTSILSLEGKTDCTHLAFFDADTNINNSFTEEWFLGDSVGGQHYADQMEGWMKEKKGYERNPISKAYIPLDTPLFQMYFYGAFFSFTTKNMMKFCKTLREWQLEDKKIPYEPGCNDESYIQKYFHYNPPTKTVYCKDFAFAISDKGGIGDPRHMNLSVEDLKKELKLFKNSNINIQNNIVTHD